jgi:hypothetical protein
MKTPINSVRLSHCLKCRNHSVEHNLSLHYKNSDYFTLLSFETIYAKRDNKKESCSSRRSRYQHCKSVSEGHLVHWPAGSPLATSTTIRALSQIDKTDPSNYSLYNDTIYALQIQLIYNYRNKIKFFTHSLSYFPLTYLLIRTAFQNVKFEWFLFISSFYRVLYVVCNLLGCSPAYGV